MNATNFEIRPFANSAVFCVKENDGYFEVTSKIIRQLGIKQSESIETRFGREVSTYTLNEASWRSEQGASFDDVIKSLPNIICELIKPE